MMNKKAMDITAFLNKALILGLIFFFIFIIWGSGGGFVTLAKIGSAMSKIPGMVWVIVGLIALFMWLKK